MNKTAPEHVFDIIEKFGPIGPTAIATHLNKSPQNVHRHLKSLQETNRIKKLGSPPKVLYQTVQLDKRPNLPNLDHATQQYIDDNYLNVKPDGEKLSGVAAFEWWALRTQQARHFRQLAQELVKNHQAYNQPAAYAVDACLTLL